jgi:hypothetical protein
MPSDAKTPGELGFELLVGFAARFLTRVVTGRSGGGNGVPCSSPKVGSATAFAAMRYTQGPKRSPSARVERPRC